MKNRRNDVGVMSAFIAGLSLVLMLIGFFAVETCYANVAVTQLRNVCDAASMAAAARLVSSPEKDPVAGRNRGRELALLLIRNSSILGYSLKDAISVVDDVQTIDRLPPGTGAVSIDFLDEKGREARKGKHIQVQAAFCVEPFMAKVFGFKPYLVKACGRSSAAKLDLVFCLDNSASMAMESHVMKVRREWKHPATLAQPFLNAEAKPAQTPGELNYTELAKGACRYISGAGHPEPLYFDAPWSQRGTAFDGNMRGPKGDEGENGPGNLYDSQYQSNGFTDVLVLDERDNSFLGDFRMAVEAARGNLANEDVFEKSGVRKTFEKLGLIQPGQACPKIKKEDYERWALDHTEPFHKATNEIKEFFDMMENNTDSHFCLVPFSASAAKYENQTLEEFRVARHGKYDQGGKRRFPFAKVELSKVSSKYNKIHSTIDTYHLHGGTAIASSIYEGVDTLTDNSKCRADARKAMLLFTDGGPTEKIRGEDPAESCYTAAEYARDHGVTIFTIGFFHSEKDYSESGPKGVLKKIAATTGGKDFVVEDGDVRGLHRVFQVLARELVTLE